MSQQFNLSEPKCTDKNFFWDNLPVCIVSVKQDECLTITYANNNFFSLSFLKRGNGLSEMMSKEDFYCLKQKLLKLNNENKTIEIATFIYFAPKGCVPVLIKALYWQGEIILVINEYYSLMKTSNLANIGKKEYDLLQSSNNTYIIRYDYLTGSVTLSDMLAKLFSYTEQNKNFLWFLYENGIVQKESVKKYLAFLDDIFVAKKGAKNVFLLKREDGSLRWYCFECNYIYTINETPLASLIIMKDVTKFRETEFISMALKKTDMLVGFLFDKQTKVCEEEKKYCTSFKTSFIGCKISVLFTMMCSLLADNTKANTLIEFYEEFVLKNCDENKSIEICLKSGSYGKCWVKICLRSVFDTFTNKEKLLVYIKNINKHKKEILSLKAKALKDPLTNVLSRCAFEEAFETITKREPDKKYAFLMIDVDDFKKINDSYGHFAGDEVLNIIAKELSAILRETDIVGRMGGDEFSVILSDIPGSSFLSERLYVLCRQVEEDLLLIGKSVTLSIGASVFPYDGETFSTLYKKADQALYAAKEKGKNGYFIYDGN